MYFTPYVVGIAAMNDLSSQHQSRACVHSVVVIESFLIKQSYSLWNTSIPEITVFIP